MRRTVSAGAAGLGVRDFINMRPNRLPLAIACLTMGLAPPIGAQGVPAVRVVLPGYGTPIAIDTILAITNHDASPLRVWTAVARVFDDYHIVPDIRDSLRLVVGATRYVKSTSMANFTMSAILECGSSMTGPNADNFRITSALVAVVRPQPDGKTVLGIGFIGSGRDVRGVSTDPVKCASTGRLEADLANRVRTLLRTPGGDV
jgi:hypothetical protein